MNHDINNPRHPWRRLTAAARTVNDDASDRAAPYGFSTRAVALAFSQEVRLVSLFDRFALRALSVSCLLALGSVALNYQAIESVPVAPVAPVVMAASISPVDVLLPQTDAVAVIFDLAD